MPYNGSGTFVRKHNWTQEASIGTPILATNFDDDTNDIASAGLSNCITRDGQGSATANIPFNNFRITILGTPINPTDAATAGYVDVSPVDRSMGGHRITNLADPINPQDAATRAWVGGTTTQLPDQTGKQGSFLATNGTIASWQPAVGNSLFLFYNCGGF